MLFNSLQFAVFFPLVTAIYFLLPHRFRWLLLLLASCGFYMAFIPVYILILFTTILVDYFAALWIDKTVGRKKRYFLVLSIVSTCLVLFVFKYCNFFCRNVDAFAHLIGWNYSVGALKIILPIGLSFHTFQSLSYVIEVYRGTQKPERHFGIYSLYVMFYPQLVAGPIERPQNLLHQLREPHTFDYERVTSGLRLMAWGLFKKVVIADRLAIYVNAVYAQPREFGGLSLGLATLAFAYQIYCDFSGYSDMAIGAARVMGIKLMTNFNCPYYSQSIGEFWRRWHISLSTWFRDYVYIPLGGNRVSTGRWYFNLWLTFVISGLWHGANWTFVLWGLLNGLYLVGGVATSRWRAALYERAGVNPAAPLAAAWRILCTFFLTCMGWILFRANSIDDAWYILTHLWKSAAGVRAAVQSFQHQDLFLVLMAIAVVECVQLVRQPGLKLPRLATLPLPVRWSGYYGFLLFLVLFGVYRETQFIYFQF